MKFKSWGGVVESGCGLSLSSSSWCLPSSWSSLV